MMNNEQTQYGIIWDVDGTLLDSAEMHFRAWVKLAEGIGQPFTRDDFTNTFGRRNPEIIRSLFGEHHTDDDVARLGNEKEEYYRAEATQGIELLPGVRKLLANLHAAGYRQAVGSSAPRQNLDVLLKLTGIEEYFDVVVGMEDTTRGKPDPEVFLVAAERLGVTPQDCIVFEDAVAGVEAAKAGGMQCVAVTFVGHHAPERLKGAGADLIVHSLEEVSVETVEFLLLNGK
jgi:beta-phosphoglucomutase